MNLRRAIKAELKRQRRSIYWLGHHPNVDCHYETVRLFLAGKRSISSDTLEGILKVLRMKIDASTTKTTTRLSSFDAFL